MRLVILAVFVSVLALQTLTLQAYPVTGYTRIYEGVELATGTATSPRLMRAWAIRVSLGNPNVSFFATPSNGGAPYETVMQTTPTFRSAYGLEAAIDANLSVLHSPNADVEGLLISNGTTVSLDQPLRQAQVRLTAEKLASITGSGGNPTGMHTAVAGDAYHLVNGTPLGETTVLHPRTSLGISQDYNYLIMVVVDGRQTGWSDGATVYDMSLWQQSFGAYNAILLDGGGSSCICTASGGVLNRPSDGSPRSIGANFGVNTGSVTTFGPAAESWSSNNIWVVAKGAGNKVMRKYHDGSSWHDWGGEGETTTRTPAIACPSANNMGLFWVNPSNSHLYHKYWNGSTWTSVVDLGASCTSSPAASSWGSNRLDVVVRNSDNYLYHRSWNGSAWSGWHKISGMSPNSDPAIVSGAWGEGRVDVFARGTSNAIWWSASTDGGVTWSAWQSLGGSWTTAPAACSWGYGCLDVVAGDGSTIRHIYRRNGTGWTAWNNTGTPSTSAPGIMAKYEGLIGLYTRGANDWLYQTTLTGSSWGAESPVSYFY